MFVLFNLLSNVLVNHHYDKTRDVRNANSNENPSQIVGKVWITAHHKSVDQVHTHENAKLIEAFLSVVLFGLVRVACSNVNEGHDRIMSHQNYLHAWVLVYEN